MREALTYESNKDMSLQGSALHLSITDNALRMEADVAEAFYVSEVFDCGETGGTWDELHLHFIRLWELQVSVWMFDSETTKDQLLSFPVEDRLHVIRQNGVTQPFPDMLLYGREQETRGRFLIFCFQVRKPKGETLLFTAYELTFPAILFSEYLPYVYQNNPTLDAYLSVYKDVYLSLEREIDLFYLQLDPMSARKENLRELLAWQGLDSFQAYTDLSDLRHLPALWADLQKQRGSLYYFIRMVRFLFHTDSCLHLQEDVLQVTVPSLDKEKERKLLLFFQQEVPCGITVRVMFTRQSYLDNNAYLGITSSLSKAKGVMNTAALDCLEVMK